MKVYLESLGCRLNQAEMEAMARDFLATGHEVVGEGEAAEVAIVNTCAVTAMAERKSRHALSRVVRQNSQARVIATGCYAQLSPQRAAGIPGVHEVVGNLDKDALALRLAGQPEMPDFDREPLLRGYRPGLAGRTRLFVKVQDGCDNRCTFCITTIARGPGRSRPIADVVSEIQAAAEAGYQEAVLTGVHLGSYGHDLGQRDRLRPLVQTILDETTIPRLRLSSLEPWDLDEDFFSLWADPRMSRHLHLPLQSGCAATLRRMARRTTPESFAGLIEAARRIIPDVSITTDVIVGFPGETEAEFQASHDYIAALGLSRLHVFSYSRRPGTAAARMPGQVPEPEKRERHQAMERISRESALAFHRRFAGRTLPALWESIQGADEHGWRYHGFTGNYIRVTTHSCELLTNRITFTLLSSPDADGMAGEVVAGEIRDG